MLRTSMRFFSAIPQREYASGSEAHLKLQKALSDKLSMYRETNKKMTEMSFLRKIIDEYGESTPAVKNVDSKNKRRMMNDHSLEVAVMQDTIRAQKDILVVQREVFMQQALEILDDIKAECADSSDEIHAAAGPKFR